MASVAETASRRRDFPLTVMGRTLEHLGTQMYKRRDAALAELVANAWDAGATEVEVDLAVASYDPATSHVVIRDNGSGMGEDDVEDAYLVVGRNRRTEGQEAPLGRPPMGRKGIGKLAGFGLSRVMQVETWQDGGPYTELTLDVGELKKPAGQAEQVLIPGAVSDALPEGLPSSSGTRLTLSGLKHKTPVDENGLRESLARRFSRTVLGSMVIRVNGVEVAEPALQLDFRLPSGADAWETATLDDGSSIRFWYGFAETVINSTQLRGWTILVRGKTAQAPNFFFFVEGSASGQHGTKSFTGVIEADELDAGDDDETDLISTDRQELDWEDERTRALLEWGDRTTRDALRTRANRRGDEVERKIFEEPGFRERIERFEPATQERVKTYMRKLGQADAADDSLLGLADQIILAFEYQNFHDVITQLDEVADDPEQLQTFLSHLAEWKVLESRAILEIVSGRLQIIDKLAVLLASNAPETAHVIGDENLHDLLADYPWIINPEWQVLAEEKTITKQLQDWGAEAEEGADAKRYDFLALKGEDRLVLIELKRPSHAVENADVARLQDYRVRLEAAQGPIQMVLISGGEFNFRYTPTEDLEVLTWAEIHTRTRSYYEHYRAVLSGEIDDPDFDRKARELQRTRRVLEHGAFRGKAQRALGLGEQDTLLEAERVSDDGRD